MILTPPSTLLLGLVVVGCAVPHYGSTVRVPGATEVVFLGSLHRRHLRSEHYPLRHVRELLTQIRPTVVFVQLPPGHTELDPDDPWLVAMPAVAEALSFAHEHGLQVVGISGHHREDRRRWRAYERRFPNGPKDPAYRRARDYLVRRNAREGGTDPYWLASPLYRHLTAWTDRTRQRAMLPDPATPEWNEHRRLFREALIQAQGERIVVIFDARRVWVLAEQLAWGHAHEIDLRAFLEASESARNAASH